MEAVSIQTTPMDSMTVEEVADSLLRLSQKTGFPTHCTFDGVHMGALPQDTVEDVLTAYRAG